MSAKVLTQRLRRLEARGWVRRADVPTTPRTVEYSLTDRGRALQTPLEQLLGVLGGSPHLPS